MENIAVFISNSMYSEFIFNKSEQAFYKEKGFENEPQRCPDCRKARKQQKTAIGTAEEVMVIGGK